MVLETNQTDIETIRSMIAQDKAMYDPEIQDVSGLRGLQGISQTEKQQQTDTYNAIETLRQRQAEQDRIAPVQNVGELYNPSNNQYSTYDQEVKTLEDLSNIDAFRARQQYSMAAFWIILGIIVFLVLRFIIIRNNKLTKNVDHYGGMRRKYAPILEGSNVCIISEKRDYIHFSYTFNGVTIIGQIVEGARVIMNVFILCSHGERLCNKSFTVPSGADPQCLIRSFESYVAEYTDFSDMDDFIRRVL